MTGHPAAVADLTLEELRTLHASNDPDYPNEPIPTLAELAEICGDRAQMLLDLKVLGSAGPIADVLSDVGFPPERVAMITWIEEQTNDAVRQMPRAKLFYSAEDPLGKAADDEWFGMLPRPRVSPAYRSTGAT